MDSNDSIGGFRFAKSAKKWWGWPKQRIPRKLKKKLKKLGKYVKPPNARTTHREVYFTKPAYTLNINDKRYIK